MTAAAQTLTLVAPRNQEGTGDGGRPRRALRGPHVNTLGDKLPMGMGGPCSKSCPGDCVFRVLEVDG